MRAAERARLRQRFQFRCGYCGVREIDVGAELTVDHFQPRSRDGAETPDNWVYCCHACNEFKGAYWQPDSSRRILHPLHDKTSNLNLTRKDCPGGALSETQKARNRSIQRIVNFDHPPTFRRRIGKNVPRGSGFQR